MEFVLIVRLEVLILVLLDLILVVLQIVNLALLVELPYLAQIVFPHMLNLVQHVFNVMLIVKTYNVLVMELDSVIINYVKLDLVLLVLILVKHVHQIVLLA